MWSLFLETSLLSPWWCKWKATMPSYHATCVKSRASGMIYRSHTISHWIKTTFLQPRPISTIFLHFLSVPMRGLSSKLKKFKMLSLQLLQIGLQPYTASKTYLFWAAWPLFLSQLHFLTTSCISSGPTSFPTSSSCEQETLRISTIKMRVIYFWKVHGRQLEQQRCCRWYYICCIWGPTPQSRFRCIPHICQNVFYLDIVLCTYSTTPSVSTTMIL